MVPVQVSKGPVNVIKILQKAGGFAVFIRLIKSTQEDIQVFSQLNDSRDGVTIFAPTDGAFSAIIKSGVLNSLSDHQKIELVQFHIIPKVLTTANFQTVSNPITTLAGSGSRFALNVITTENMVNVTSGLTNTSVSAIVYTDSQLAIYQVDKVLLPLDIFAPKPLAPAPSPPKPKKDDGADTPMVPKDISGAVSCVMLNTMLISGVIMKAGGFAVFIRLIKSTQEDIQVFSQLNDSRDGVTIFAPTDGAFSAIIKSGVLNSLSDHQKIELVQFHIIPKILTTANFQTVSNPITTLAGSGSRFALNVITTENMVNVTSGLTNTSVSAIVYTDSQLAIYQVDKVLLPLDIFAPKPIAPAPSPPKPKKDDGAESPLAPEDISGAVSCVMLNSLVIFGAGMAAAVFPL
ncbi:hypothetical protein SADUNF_Sadunf12G0012600 [Salix dunnii]|uniref:FAS1 domain-containing protein n=1 Tax=Salix dunnii TaxID=1413687 RepID=A0A835JM70_9ROSI|nr:hypothetical protein SADUNF_Sadunf12G0012600 [Salix dunnii]